MTLGLVLACLWVIFRRSGAPWRTAWRMFLVFLLVLFFSSIIVSMLPGFHQTALLVVGLASLTAAIVTGFRQARAFPRSKPAAARFERSGN